MIYTLTLNPALDYDMYIKEDLKTEHLNLADKVNYRAGGKGINVSKVLKNLDVESVAIGYTAGFTGNFIIEDLKKDGIKSEFVELDGNTRINVKVNGNDKETEITGVSPVISEEKLKLLMEKVSHLKDGDILVLSGSIPESVSKTVYKELSEKIKTDVEIVLDTRGNLLQNNIHNNFFIKPNIHELRDMFDEKLETKQEIVKKCSFFLERGVKNVIISRGGDGALLVNKDFVLEASVPKGELINSIGAGDSMVAGFIAGYVKGMSTEDSFRLAVAAGSATAYSYGLAEKDFVNKLYEEINIVKEGV
ncbi:1-phosphofructokinase [Pseudoleptotrichia goodfellowii]|uniref:1-phosphofructokinase n=2 Tax=Pseudoleptotrichia goodfellowii TaxID=157692 RepID=D0GK07_9FUSO|nr:1-phosphofructokinase [Pseudoleptotrichia goodfellowii]EEY35574.1 1-phosphofructokinase [Pseudoleptotrichia goodfellowii F0264]BBM36455.1 1-phosphofructokinase [Pseudoleptotrichia goodfellowii]